VRVHSTDDLSAKLGLPIIGRIPKFSRRDMQSGRLAVVTDPDGVAAEAFRMLRGDLDFVSVDAKVSSMLVTSCTRDEGKTTTLCNLGVTFARAGKRVVIIDADLRRSKVHAYFDLRNTVGLSSVISGRTKLEDVVHAIPVPVADDTAAAAAGRLGVITSGPLPPNPGEIVTSKRLARLIETLTQSFDVVLVDSPPFLAVGDAAALSVDLDGVLMVMKMGYVTKPMVKEAREWLDHVQCRKLGIVVTNYSLDGGAGYGYSYYRNYSSEVRPRHEQLDQDPVGHVAG
jgi:capsular exopolysaccharide synthesis family protein